MQLVYLVTIYSLPATFTGIFASEPLRVVKNWHPFVCVAAGLWGGLIIGLVTEYYTSNRYAPVQVPANPTLQLGGSASACTVWPCCVNHWPCHQVLLQQPLCSRPGASGRAAAER